MGTVEGAGNSVTQKDYSFTGTASSSGTSYYRLKQTDFNGQFEYSDIIAIENCQKETDELIIYPNPSYGIFNIIFNGDPTQFLSMEIDNSAGEKIYFSESFQPSIDLSEMSSGNYFVHFNLDAKTITKEIVLQK